MLTMVCVAGVLSWLCQPQLGTQTRLQAGCRVSSHCSSSRTSSQEPRELLLAIRSTSFSTRTDTLIFPTTDTTSQLPRDRQSQQLTTSCVGCTPVLCSRLTSFSAVAFHHKSVWSHLTVLSCTKPWLQLYSISLTYWAELQWRLHMQHRTWTTWRACFKMLCQLRYMWQLPFLQVKHQVSRSPGHSCTLQATTFAL